MTTKPTAKKFRVRKPMVDAGEAAPAAAEQSAPPQRPEPVQQQATAAPQPMPEPANNNVDIDAIRREGLTGRQLRMARRVAQKQGLAVTSDFDAVRQLRLAGIDPFQRSTVLELVAPDQQGGQQSGGANPQTGGPQTLGAIKPVPQDRVQLPQTRTHGNQLPSTEFADPITRRNDEISQIQRDMARRRRLKAFLMMVRLSIFVLLPTMIVGYYYYTIATPMYATDSEFVIQQAEPASAAGGLGGMFQGTSMATQQDSITVQSYLQSRAAMVRLDADHDFKAHFSQDWIDPIQRLPEDATNEAAYGVYQDMVKISYDPTEGILRMKVIAASPEVSQEFSNALIGYAEEQVDQLTQRLREDQMAGARDSYVAAEAARANALQAWLQIQEDVQQIDPIGETSARTQQISALESERQRLTLALQERLAVRTPNQAQVNALESQISNIETLIADLRQQMTTANAEGTSLAARNTELRLAEENYTFQTGLAQQALTQMETARIEANRQVRYLSMGVEPVAPDEATYPKAFENTILAFLIFSGIYLMISITASILREQVTS
ncbi:capsular polysaccharide transport system permease protein [Loktanella sp. DSM 29012]|uniref:capsule biosynthesis protein n=1 Tax=Loktanella sp. DSM 29012 TaxID=1881056 RepID=UPI0008AF9785|nr:capsule biosynthesis protein [Loktanella sp. DSM 29012]SEQ64565.1 capsular polysaccharide transport system permease protein [Loktanella sp. DSM 29012]